MGRGAFFCEEMNMSGKDFYKILGVSQTASADEIKKAYRKLAMKHHPDKNPGDKVAEQKFRDISEAYEILKDDQKRAAFDRYGSAAFDQNSGFQPGAGAGSGFGGFDFGGNFSDIIDEMFSGMGGRGGRSSQANDLFRQPGSDVRYNLDLSLKEAFQGVTSRVKYTTAVTCEPCRGTGSDGGVAPVACKTCSGRGTARFQQGFFTTDSISDQKNFKKPVGKFTIFLRQICKILCNFGP